MAPPDAQRVLVEQGGSIAAPSLLGQGPARIPTGGKIRAGIKVLTTRKAAEQPLAQAIYDQGVAAGQSFEQIERAIAEALPDLKTPLVPRNVQWFTVRAAGLRRTRRSPGRSSTPMARTAARARRLYRFPVVFPTDHWQTVMPHELATWGVHDKRFWSRVFGRRTGRHCMTHAPVPVDETGRRTIRLFGGRRTDASRRQRWGLPAGVLPRVPAAPVQPRADASCSSSRASARSAPSSCTRAASTR